MFTKNLILVIIIFLISGCSGEKCIDPDDFGFPNFSISARYKSELIEGEKLNQVGPWIDLGLKVNGRPITIIVKNWDADNYRNNATELSAWSSWFGKEGDENKLASIIARMSDCQFENNDTCPASGGDMVIVNPPCLFKKGVGLYGLIAKPGENPNISRTSKENPIGIAFHIGSPQNGYTLESVSKNGDMENVGGIVFNYNMAGLTGTPDDLKQEYEQAKFYFKILDRYYSDNSGQYKVVIKSGVDVARADPLTYLTELVKTLLFGNAEKNGVIKNIFNGIITQSSFQVTVRALLILFVIFSAISYLLGLLKISNKELIARIIKISIVSALLTTTTAWNFFYNNLFTFFIDGLDYLVNLVSKSSGNGEWGKLPLLSIMMAPQTLSKVFSLLFMSYKGWFFIIVFICLLFFVLMISIKIIIIYLTALIVISLIIALAPIFICFILFDFTRPLFDNWIRQLTSYILQPILLFAGVAFIGVLSQGIIKEIYSSLGYRVCKQELFNFGPVKQILGSFAEEFGMGPDSTSLTYFWFPYPRDMSTISTQTKIIPIPYDHTDSNGVFCHAYECLGPRIPSLPFLDPNNPRDAKRIANYSVGNFIDLENLIYFIIAVYLLNQFNSLLVNIARILSNTSGSLTSLGDAAGGAEKALNSFVSKRVKGVVERSSLAAYYNKAKSAVVSRAGALAEKIYDKKYESMAEGALTKEALTSVKRKAELATGVRYEDLNLKEYNEYKKTMGELIKESGIKGYKDTDLLRMSPDKLKEALSLGKMGSSYENLSNTQKETIDKLLSDKEKKLGMSLEKYKKSFKNVEDYQQAYIEQNLKMTQSGIGYFGKRSSLLRKYQEAGNEVELRESRLQAKKFDRLSRMYKTYDELLGNITGGTFGGNYEYFDYENKRMLTYGEQILESDLSKRGDLLEREINIEVNKQGRDIENPEYIAELYLAGNSGLSAYNQSFAEQHIEQEVYNTLTNGDSPILKGRKFMEERMSDTEFQKSVDAAYEAKNNMIENDPYIKSKQDYLERIKNKEQEIITEFSKIENNNLKESLSQALDNPELKAEEIDKLLPGDANNDMRKLVKEYYLDQNIVHKIDEREAAIENAFGFYINEMNNFREKADMDPYKPFSKVTPPAKTTSSLSRKLS